MVDNKFPNITCDKCGKRRSTFHLMVVDLFYCTKCTFRKLKAELNNGT